MGGKNSVLHIINLGLKPTPWIKATQLAQIINMLSTRLKLSIRLTKSLGSHITQLIKLKEQMIEKIQKAL